MYKNIDVTIVKEVLGQKGEETISRSTNLTGDHFRHEIKVIVVKRVKRLKAINSVFKTSTITPKDR